MSQELRELGEWLRNARRGLGLSQEQLEKDSGVAQSTMSKLEAGQGKLMSPSLVALRLICEALNLSLLEAYHRAGLLSFEDERDRDAIAAAQFVAHMDEGQRREALAALERIAAGR